jgi:RimJ/RimL family protein N-acetyltransferase
MLDRLPWRRRHQDDEAEAEPESISEAPLVREGERVRLREHVPANKAAFQRWYADPEIANLLRHDLSPLTPAQSASYFDSLILPLTVRGLCYAIHEAETDRLIGTTALTDVSRRTTGRGSALFRIVIGEKDLWNRGYGTEATRLVVAEAFETHDLTEVRLEVFRHNPRAIRAYQRVGFVITGEHVEWVGRSRRELNVIEMKLRRLDWEASRAEDTTEITPAGAAYTGTEPDALGFSDADVDRGEMGESEADRAARLERRRARREYRRLRDVVPEESATSPGSDDDRSISPS